MRLIIDLFGIASRDRPYTGIDSIATVQAVLRTDSLWITSVPGEDGRSCHYSLKLDIHSAAASHTTRHLQVSAQPA